MKNQNNKSKCLLSNNLCVIAGKQKSADLAILTITDFIDSIRLPFDITGKKLLDNKCNFQLTNDDADKICAWLKS